MGWISVVCVFESRLMRETNSPHLTLSRAMSPRRATRVMWVSAGFAVWIGVGAGVASVAALGAAALDSAAGTCVDAGGTSGLSSRVAWRWQAVASRAMTT